MVGLALLGCQTSCVAHRHVVGLGPTGGAEIVDRQYYWVFGLFQINDVETQRLAENLTSYSVETRFGFTDLLLAPLLLPFTATSRTVIVRT